MADPSLSDGQYSVGVPGSGTAFVYGGRPGSFAHGVQIASTAVDPGDIAAQDQAVVGHDGVLFGYDTAAGMTVTQTGQVVTGGGPGAMDSYSLLAAAWNDPLIRLQAGKVATLRARYPGSDVVRRCYGRGRKITPAMGSAAQGVVPFVASFQAADGIWYGDEEQSLTMTMITSGRGVASPLTAPFRPAPVISKVDNVVVNFGALPTWPVITITGPVSNPGVTYPDTPVSIGYRGHLGASDSLVIDTRPWARTAKVNGGSVAGAVTGDPMIALQLPTGNTRVRFTAQDFAGLSVLTITWRNAFLAIGGSIA